MRAGVIIAGVLAVGLAAVVFINMNNSAEEAVNTAPAVASAPEIKAVNIFVASQPIPVGAVITQEMLAVQPWPEHLMLDGFVRSDEGGISENIKGSKTGIVGNVARAAFQAQEPILATKLANPSDPNFLAGELPKGMRVVSIVTNETESVAGFVFPGDYVDVLLTHDVEKLRPAPSDPERQEIEVEKKSVTETLLTNVKVVAVDQRSSGAQATDAEGKLVIPHSVSLMVSPTDAQRVRLGEKVGTLTLSLRSLADRESADPLTLTETKDISQHKDTQVEGRNSRVIIHRGAPQDSNEDNANSAGGLAPLLNTNPQPTAGMQ